MMKRFMAILVASFLLLPAIAAYADAIAEIDNDFYNRNGGDCVYLGRNFHAAGETVSIKKAPRSGETVAVAASDETIYIDYSCLYKGEFWGFTQRHDGWVKLDELLVLYDYVAFEEEYWEEFYSYQGDYAALKETCAALCFRLL